MQQRVMLYTYGFVLGVAFGTGFQPDISWVWPLYIVAAVFGLLGWSLAVAQDQGMRRIKKGMVFACLALSAVPFGIGRYVERSHIPPFDPALNEGNHIKAILDEYPDPDFKTTTRIVGRIIAEPEYRPVKGLPGVVVLTVQPMEIEPEPGSGTIHKVADGNVAVFLRPFTQFRRHERDFEEIFMQLADAEAYGYIIEVTGPFRTFRGADNPGLFDPEVFNNDKDIFASTNIPFWDKNNPPLKIIDEEEGNLLVETALSLKTRLLGVIKVTVPFPESAFLAGVTLGARRGLDGVRSKFEDAGTPPEEEWGEDEEDAAEKPDLRQLVLDQFRWSGTSHVLAVSGLHVTIISGALWGLFLLMKIPKKVYAPLVCLGLVIFCLITGAAPSSIRATIMNSLVILTYVYLGAAFRASLLLAIGVSGFAILLNNPKWLVQPAFSLSFMAVLSLGILTPPFEQILRKVPGYKKLPYWLQQFISAQGAIQFGMMAPLSAYYFCRMSLAGPFANFFAIPLIGIIVQLGLFACLLGLIPSIGIYFALVLNAANYIIIWFFLWVVHISTLIIPFPHVQTLTPRMMAAYYFLLALFVWNKQLLRQAKILYYDLSMGIGGPRRRVEAIIKLGGFFLLVSGVAIFGFWPRMPSGELHFNILSVRYGQAIHIETPSGAHILVDGGPNDHIGGWNTGERVVAQYLLKHRIGNLDAIIMTTTSPEDMGGLGAILRIFPTRRFYAPISPWRWDPDNPEEFRAEAARAVGNDAAESPRNSDFEATVFHLSEIARRLRAPWGVMRVIEVLSTSPLSLLTSFGPPQPIQVEAGMVLWRERGPGGDLEIVALHPNPDFPLSPTNNNSLVLRVTYGQRSFLITGDLTEEGIREVLRISPDLLRADLLVVPAHGSSKSDIEQFHNTVLPPGADHRYAVISWGRDRALRPRRRSRESYRDSFLSHRQLFQKDVEAGAANTERRLREAGIRVARTDIHGAILCRTDGDRFEVRAVLGDFAGADVDVAEETERHREFH